MSEKIRVVVLFGGRSSEHVVSCVTATGILGAMDRELHEVIPVGITTEGSFILVPEDEVNYRLTDEPLRTLEDNGTRIIWPDTVASRELKVITATGDIESLGDIDVVFPMLHGTWGEDGTVQGMLELTDIPYVGSGVMASAVCMDKHVSKVLFQSAGISVAPWRTVTRVEYERGLGLAGLVEGLDFPLFVKPARAGSSVGVSRITALDELPEALEVAFHEDHVVLIETGITGREVEIAVLEGGGSATPQVSSVLGEIIFSGKDFYDFEAKYLGSDGVQLVLPAKVTDAEYASIRDAAILAFSVAQCSGPARVDFFLTDDGAVLNEINTMPGFTPISMYPQLWEKSGLAYSELITRLIALARNTER